MKINNIDYCLTLFFCDENAECIKELDFEDFYAFNKFAKEHKYDPEYSGYQPLYTFREIIDGAPDLHSWEQSIEFRELSQEEIQLAIEDYLSYLVESEEFSEKLDSFSKELHYRVDYSDNSAKKYHLQDFVYVCPHCMREVEHCRCKCFPYYLVQIDKLMLPIIRELNINGFTTVGCCAGHPCSEKPMQIYISFDKEYNFDMPFPAGGRYSKLRHSISYFPPEDLPKEEYATFQERVIEELSEWAEMLLPADSDD